MDLITQSILAALSADLSDPARVASSTAYETLKQSLYQKFGPDSELVEALHKLEKKPDSSARQDWFSEEIRTAKADQDPELLALAQQLWQTLTAKPEASKPAEPAAPPLQRPPRPDHFTGREAELAHLLNELRPGQVIALWGPAGVGKSALAAEAIWRLFSEETPPALFPD